MRRGVWVLVLGALLAALGAASAYAAGTTTTTATTTTGTTSTTTTSTTTTATTTTTGTTTTTPSTTYSRLTPSYLDKGCVGAGAVAIAEPGRQVLALDTPASNLGASEYPTAAPIVRFRWATGTGSACTSAHVELGSVALFGGVVTASSVEATHGRGTVSGFEIYGSPVTLRAGHTLDIGGWGQVSVGKTVGRLTAPLVVQLLTAHHSLPAGTTIAFAFGASPQVGRTSKTGQAGSSGARKGTQKGGKQKQQPAKPPPDFPASASPFAKGGGFTEAAKDNPVVSIAMRYLGIRYQWGGASPKTGFDCSGLVKYVFAQLGVPLIHFAAAQWHAPGGVWVPPNRLRAGDLVFFTGSDGTHKEPGHVGIYVDDGYFIDAPHTGSFVRVDRLTEKKFANEYVGARRIVLASFEARRLSHVTKPDAPTTDFPVGFPQPLTIGPLGDSVAAASATTIALGQASHNVPLLVGGPLAGLLALTAVAGAFTFRRRRRTAAAVDPSS